MTGRRALRLLPLVLAAVLGASSLGAPHFTWANEGVIIDHPWTHPAAALAGAVAASLAAFLARPRPLAICGGFLSLVLVVLAAWQLRFRVDVLESAFRNRTLSGSTELAWKELATVEPRADAITLRARDGRSVSIATGRFAPEDRNRLERTVARRVKEAGQ